MRSNRYEEAAEERRRLENDLGRTRETVMELMTGEARAILKSYIHKPADEPVWQWAPRAADQILALCEGITQQTYSGFPFGAPPAPRALCPLCKRGTSSPYETGFAIPEGLTRHLLGTYNSHQCGVFAVAVAMARHHEEMMVPRADGPNWAALAERTFRPTTPAPRRKQKK